MEIRGYSLTSWVAYVVVFLVTYAVVGSADNAYDAFVFSGDVARHDAERALSAAFDLMVVLGLTFLWVIKARTLLGGAIVGLVVGYAAGGIHVLAYMGEWLPVAMAVGLAGAFLVFALVRRPIACSLFGVLSALATVQILFLVL